MKTKTGKHKIKVVRDLFARCENTTCKKWVRLYKEDEIGERTIPLFNIFVSTLGHEIFVCEECFDKKIASNE